MTHQLLNRSVETSPAITASVTGSGTGFGTGRVEHLAIRPCDIGELQQASARALSRDVGLMSGVWLDEVEGARNLYDVVEGVAIVPVQGTLVPRSAWVGASWATGYNVLQLQLSAALRDPAVKGIALLIDSSGGYVKGLYELVDWFNVARAASPKPVVSLVQDVAYSAAYQLACLGDQISVPRTGGVGSIGTLMVHWEYSQWLEKMGDRVTVIRSGAKKADGNPYEPLPDHVKAEMQALLDEFRDIFAETVVRLRVEAGASVTVDAVLKTEARLFEGPKGLATAKSIGLLDQIMTPHEAFQHFAGWLAAA